MKPWAYYNEIDSYAAQWLRNLIAGGHIAPGEVDERSIEDVTPDDLRGFTQCHFFAGIGVWSHSLRLAGWPDDKPVWTGSCPCQPFSAAGKGNGFGDERHLWPSFQWLIDECKPEHIFGEQVASGNADVWFDLVQADMEGMGYTFGHTPFPAAGVGSPNIRERSYWVANSYMQYEPTAGDAPGIAESIRSSPTFGVDNSKLLGWNEGGRGDNPEHDRKQPDAAGEVFGMADSDGIEQRSVAIDGACVEHVSRGWQQGTTTFTGLCGDMRPLEVNGFWRDADWIFCRDGKWRPVEPGTFPLVDGAATRLGRVEPGVARVASSNRVGRLRGYGNAINAHAAAAFIRAYLEVSDGR